MKSFLILTSFFVICGSQSYPPYPQQPPRGLGYQESVSQAKRQLHSFYAKNIPVKESISNMEEYYIDLEEKGLRNQPHTNKLTRKPCKVLPDPQPGLVNPKLVDPIYKYHPIYKNEKFFGEFAPPVKFEYMNGQSQQMNRQMKRNYPNRRNYHYENNPNYANGPYNAKNQYPSNQYPSYQNPNNQYPQNQYPTTSYNPTNSNNPFNGFLGKYSANSEYFETETFIPPAVGEITPTTSTESVRTSTINTASWQSQLSVDYSLRIASLSSVLVANSAALSSMSASANFASMSMVWASKEASLKSKLSAYSATATTTRHSWHW